MEHLIESGGSSSRRTPGYDRVRAHSAAAVNDRLDRETEARLARLAHAPPREIGRRLGELDREWDVDRALMLLFSGLGGFTFSMGIRRSRPFAKGNGWLYLFTAQMAFLGIHAAFGWCPPVALLRRLGFRTQKEIEAERRALEGRGDGDVGTSAEKAAPRG